MCVHKGVHALICACVLEYVLEFVFARCKCMFCRTTRTTGNHQLRVNSQHLHFQIVIFIPNLYQIHTVKSVHIGIV
jgi:hypothetical protein